MQRRTLLKLGVASAAVMALAAGTASLLRGHGLLSGGPLTTSGREVFAAIARGVLAGGLPADPVARGEALAAHLDRLDATITGLPAATQSELSELLVVLSTAPGRTLMAGLVDDWPLASVESIQSALHAMRTSRLNLRQQAYHALRDLTNAAFYADASAWPLLGYPGPLEIPARRPPEVAT